MSAAPDAALMEAWREYQEARILFSLPPTDEIPEGGYQTPSENALEARFLAAESVIVAAVPSTLRGVEVQLWLQLAQTQNSEIIALCAVREDIRYFRDDAGLDFSDKLAVAALCGIISMREGGTA